MKMLQGVNTVEYVNTPLYQKREKGDCGLTVVQACGAYMCSLARRSRDPAPFSLKSWLILQ